MRKLLNSTTGRRVAGVAVACVATFALEGVPAASAAPMAEDPLNAVIEHTGIGLGLSAAIDLESGETSVESLAGNKVTLDAAGNVLGETALPPSALKVSDEPSVQGSYTCIVKTNSNSNFKAYRPAFASSSGTSHNLEWGIHPYSVDYARVVSGYYTFQFELCTTGGGHTMNWYHQWFNGGAITIGQTAHKRIGYKWATQSASSDSTKTSSSLSFQVAAGPVTIGGSTDVTPGVGDFKGNLGQGENFYGYPESWKKYDVNRVNTYFVSPNNWIWDGTGDFEGNNGHALYEWDRRYVPSTIYAYLAAQMNVFCAKWGGVYGVRCDPL